MAKGISISIAADAKAVASAVKRDVLQPLEETVEALDRVEAAGANLELEDSLRDAQRRTEDLSDETKELRTAIERAGRGGRDFGVDFKRGTDDANDGLDRAKRGVEDFRDEANSTAREAAASFDGSAESIGDAFQEVAANAFAGFGPAGAAAGLIAAAGLGFAMTAITDQQEAADELKRRLSDAYKTAAEEGRTFLDQAQIDAAALDLIFDSDARKSAQSEAQQIGVDWMTIVRAQAGDQEALNAVIDATTGKIDEAAEAQRRKAEAGQGVFDITAAEGQALEILRGKYEEQLRLQQENEAAAGRVLDYQDQAAAKESENTRRAKEALEERGRKLQEYYSQAANPPAVNIPITVNDAALRNIENRVASLSGRVISVRLEGQTGAGRYIL